MVHAFLGCFGVVWCGVCHVVWFDFFLASLFSRSGFAGLGDGMFW